MTVFIPIGQAKWKLFFFKKNKSRRHVVRKITDVHFGRYKLHGNIQTYVVDGNGRIFSDFTDNPVVKTVVEPFSGKRSAWMLFRVFVTLKRRGINSSVKGCVVGMHVVPKHTVKLCQRGNRIDIQGIEPSFLHGAEVPLNFAFAGSVTDFGVKQQNTK